MNTDDGRDHVTGAAAEAARDDLAENAGANNPPAAIDAAAPPIDPRKRPRLFVLLGVVLACVGVAWLGYSHFVGSRYVSTDNAFVAGDLARVSALTPGQVTEVSVTDTQEVERGEVLFRLDDRDQRLALEDAEAALAAARRDYREVAAQGQARTSAERTATAEIARAQAMAGVAQSDLDKAQLEFDRRRELEKTGAVSGEELSSARSALEAARANAERARADIGAARSTREQLRNETQAGLAPIAGLTEERSPAVREALAAVELARLELARTVVRAPVSGVIARRSLEVGQRVERGTVAMEIVPVDRLYVNANFKENQLGGVRIGQRVTLTSDLYGSDVEYAGRVVGLSGGTGAAFAPIPAQNATGNWIKVVQRLPVRIAIERDDLVEHPLRVGLSMEAEIDLGSSD